MDWLLVCRSCLATNAKMYSVNTYPHLKQGYEAIVGSVDLKWDNMPQYVCNFCSVVLLKFQVFKNKCIQAQKLLDAALVKNGALTNEHCREINRLAYGLTMNFTIEEEEMSIAPLNVNEYISSNTNSETYTNDLPLSEKILKLEPKPNYFIPLHKSNEEVEVALDSLVNNTVKIKVLDESLTTKKNEEDVGVTKSFMETDDDAGFLSDNDTVSELDNTEENKRCQAKNVRIEKNYTKFENQVKVNVTKTKANNSLRKNSINTKTRTVSKRNVSTKANKYHKNSRKKDKVVKSKNLEDEDELEKNKADEIKYNYKRITLTKEQQLEHMEARKNSQSYRLALFKCDKCYKGYDIEHRMKCHMIIHDPNRGPQVCELCGYRFRFLGILKKHMDCVHRYNYTCNLCDFRTPSGENAKLHHQWHQGVRYTCKYCGAEFQKNSTCLTHMRVLHPTEHVSCELCGEAFLGSHGLLVHKKRAHRDQCELPKPYCNSCGRQYHSYAALQRHMENMPDGACRNTDLSPCVQCGEYLESKESLERHVAQQHGVTNDMSGAGDGNSTYQCTECSQTFSQERSRDVHVERVHRNISWKRPIDERNRARHAKKYNLPLASHVFCEICGKTVRSGQLQIHQRTHTGERPYQCSHCSKTFAKKLILQIHLRTHTGERPHKCNTCGMAFRQAANLKQHLVVHTGEKKHTCHLCGNTFTQSGSLQTHIKSVHMKLPMPPRVRRKKRDQPVGPASGATHEPV